jgi:hypothetical protein
MEWNGYRKESASQDPAATPFFGVAPANVERFQPIPANATYEFIETSYFGFNIPEHAIDCEIYMWFHRQLGVASGGVTLWQGMKPFHLSAEILDYRQYLPLPRDLDDQSYPTGLRIRLLDPNGTFKIEYADPERNNRFEFITAPIMPMAVRYTGNHFTQAMSTRGQLVLFGKEYEINGFFTRDRTWSESRTEKPIKMPPLAWIAGVFNEQFAFHTMAYDSIEHRPEWRGVYALEPGKNHLWGYVYRDGRLLGVTQTDKRTVYERDGITPKSVELKLRDEEGKEFEIKGETIGMNPSSTWMNLTVLVCFMRWTCNGLTGYGDAQEVLYGDHVRRFLVT